MTTVKVKKDYTSPSDPGWSRQWSLVSMCSILCTHARTQSHRHTHTHPHTQENSGQYGQSGLDLNVEPAWMQGVTGHGVVVAVVDDGQ